MTLTHQTTLGTVVVQGSSTDALKKSLGEDIALLNALTAYCTELNAAIAAVRSKINEVIAYEQATDLPSGATPPSPLPEL